MIVGLYAILPIVKELQKREELYYYFVFLNAVSTIVLPTLESFPMTSSIKHIVDLLNLSIGNEYLFYFLMGNILYEKVFSIG